MSEMRGPLMDRFSTEDDSNLCVPEQCMNRAKRCCDMIENYFLRTKWGVSICYLVGGFNPSENIWKNKKCSKPPTSYFIFVLSLHNDSTIAADGRRSSGVSWQRQIQLQQDGGTGEFAIKIAEVLMNLLSLWISIHKYDMGIRHKY